MYPKVVRYGFASADLNTQNRPYPEETSYTHRQHVHRLYEQVYPRNKAFGFFLSLFCFSIFEHRGIIKKVKVLITILQVLSLNTVLPNKRSVFPAGFEVYLSY